MKLKISKAKSYNPAQKKYGISARAISNGTATFAELCEDGGKNTSLNPAEVEACAKLFVQAAVAQIKKGMIVDLGPLGKLYPACTSGWFEKAEELTMDAIKTHVNYLPSDDIKAAITSASLSWAKAEEEDTTGDTPQAPDSEGDGDMSLE